MKVRISSITPTDLYVLSVDDAERKYLKRHTGQTIDVSLSNNTPENLRPNAISAYDLAKYTDFELANLKFQVVFNDQTVLRVMELSVLPSTNIVAVCGSGDEKEVFLFNPLGINSDSYLAFYVYP